MLRACQLMRRKSEPPSWESLQDTPVNSDTAKLQLSKSQLQHSAESLLWKSLIPDWCVLIPAQFCSQSCRSALQILHKACEVARRYNYFPGGMALVWATYYESCISSDQSCINEWNAMQDLESTRPDSPALFVDKSVLSFIMKSWLGSQEKSPFVPFVPLAVDFLSLLECLRMFFFHFPGQDAFNESPSHQPSVLSKLHCLRSVYCWFGDILSLFLFRPTERERTERLIKAKLRSIMMSKDLENVTSKEVNRKTPAPLFFLLDSFSRERYTGKEALYDEVLLAIWVYLRGSALWLCYTSVSVVVKQSSTNIRARFSRP